MISVNPELNLTALKVELVEVNLIKRLIASTKCSVCGQHYEPDNISVLGHHEELWFLRASCSDCHTQYLVAVIIKENRTPELVSDLSEAELDRFRNMGAATADEMLDMHNFLKNFNGDFSQLFNHR